MAATCRNKIPPLELPIRNVTVTSTGRTSARGIEFAIGTPQQIISLSPSLGHSDLFLYNQALCEEPQPKCAGLAGGVYDSAASSTFDQVRKDQWNGTSADTAFGDESYIFCSDVVEYGSEARFEGYPAVLIGPGYTSQSYLPLRENSTILLESYANGLAPSPTFGLYFGSRSLDAPEDGLLLIGGYDTARINQEHGLINVPWRPNSVGILSASNLIYALPNGTSIELLDEPISAGLEPAFEDVLLPAPVFQRFVAAANASVNDTLDAAVMPTDALLGNLTFKFGGGDENGGFTAVIPAYELFSKPHDYDDEGAYTITDHNTTIAMVKNVTTAEGFSQSTLGQPFMSQVYMVMDHTQQQWLIGKAIPNGGSKAVTNPLEPVIATICMLEDEIQPDQEGSGTNRGAIAGGVVGGVAGIGLIMLCIYFFFLRRRRQRAAAFAAESGSAPKSDMEDSSALPPVYEKDGGKLEVKTDGAGGYALEMSPEDKFGRTGPAMSEMASPEELGRALTLKEMPSPEQPRRTLTMSEMPSPEQTLPTMSTGDRMDGYFHRPVQKAPVEMP